MNCSFRLFRTCGRIKATLIILAMGVALHSATAVAPEWWSTRHVLTSDAIDDFAILNVGQLKNLVRGAIEELNDKLPPAGSGAGDDLNSILARWRENPANDYEAVNVGQLKAMGNRVRERLIFMGVPVARVGTSSTADDDDFVSANVGQAKTVFAFDIGDYLGNLGGADADPDHDGLTNIQEVALGTSPVISDTDADGMPDGWEHQYGLKPTYVGDAGPTETKVYHPSVPTFPLASDFYIDDGFGGTYYDEAGYNLAVESYNNEMLSYSDAYAASILIDIDSDGLSNLREYLAGTNPSSADTDSDGYSDYDEIVYGGNPLGNAVIPPVRMVITPAGTSTVKVATFRAEQIAGGITVTLVGDADTLFLPMGSSNDPMKQTASVTTDALSGTSLVYVFVLGDSRQVAVGGDGSLGATSSPITSRSWQGNVADTLNPNTTPQRGPSPKSPPPSGRVVFTASRIRNVGWSGQQSLSSPSRTVSGGSTEKIWVKPAPNVGPPPYTDDKFNGDADMEGNNADSGDPRDEVGVVPSDMPPVDAVPFEDGAYQVDNWSTGISIATGPYDTPGTMTGNYVATNAYIPPDKETGVGHGFVYSEAISKLNAVSYSRGGNNNGWMGAGIMGVSSYMVTSRLTTRKATSTMTYTDEVDATAKESSVTYDIEEAGMQQTEVRLQTNIEVLGSATPISSDFLLFKTTQSEEGAATEYVAAIRLSITHGLISDTCEVIAGALPDGDVTLQNGVVSMRSPRPVSGKTISYMLGDVIKRIWSDVYPDSMANQLPNAITDGKRYGSGVDGTKDYIMVGSFLENVSYGENGQTALADNKIKFKIDPPNIPEKLVCTLAPRNSKDPSDFVLSKQVKNNDCISVACTFTEINGTPSGEDYEVVLVYDANSNGIDKGDKIVHRTQFFIKPVARRQFDRSDTILKGFQVGGYVLLHNAFACLYAFRNGVDPPNAPDKIESEIIDVTDDSSGARPDHNTGITFTGQYTGNIKKYTYGPNTSFARTIVRTSLIEGEIRKVLNANQNKIEDDKASDSRWGSADQNSFKDYVFDVPELAKVQSFGFDVLDPNDMDIANSLGRVSVQGAKIKASIHRTDPSRGTVYFMAGTVDDCYDFDYENKSGEVEGWGSPNEHGSNVQAGHGSISSSAGTIFRIHIELTNVYTNVKPFYTPPVPITGGYP